MEIQKIMEMLVEMKATADTEQEERKAAQAKMDANQEKAEASMAKLKAKRCFNSEQEG
jgi:hypothetical protein